jgi:hypothetical protein
MVKLQISIVTATKKEADNIRNTIKSFGKMSFLTDDLNNKVSVCLQIERDDAPVAMGLLKEIGCKVSYA